MDLTIKIDKNHKSSEIDRFDVEKIIKEKRKIKLTRTGESKSAQNDGTDIATAMAATLCHEINNPLMTISAVAEVLLNHHKDLEPEIIDKIKVIAVSAERIREATHKLISLDSLKYCETAASKMIPKEDADRKSENQNNEPTFETAE